ncbi:probable leucine-rich repeat receptor-like protein kinase At5g49770 [Panicum hallii]|uniref:probable leucine-rich repeat receptor-like protein kinase At5g49770 n=1 Tax=Panicum hallii TaxID=206008 RepID=UPI000DF4ECB5|nr:probable leucine-rich repeat receptor-like protein kinase At5g49770 [Panicum hallii]
MKALSIPLLLVMFLASLPAGFCDTDPQDVAALQSLMRGWQNFPSSWKASSDPCGAQWDGITCNNGRVTSMRLSSINLQGTLGSSIGQLSELVYLDLSSNSGLSGSLPTSIGNLKQLTTLILAGCSFTGGIPQELGNLVQLSFLALNSNNFTGRIPASIGLLTNLFWLDLAENQLSGPIPISSTTSPGLDLLTHTKHFHFNKNQLTGTLNGLFSSSMRLEHILFDNNQLSGPIPAELGSITSLQILRLDKNRFTGAVPTNISNLVNLNGLNFADNQLRGTMPDLSTLTKLNAIDLSNNSFDPSVLPAWLLALETLTSIVIASGGLYGQVPNRIFTLPELQQVILSNNAFNGTLDMTGNISQQLQRVNLLNNRIVEANITQSYNRTLVLVGNPVCLDSEFSSSHFCSIQEDSIIPYVTSITKCGSTSCSSDQSLDPANCGCAYPYMGTIFFRSPLFADFTNNEHFQQLETSLWTELGLQAGSVFLSDVRFTSDDYLQVKLRMFPSTGTSFNVSEVTRIGFDLSNQTYKPPQGFGPYFFVADPYAHFAGADDSGKSKISTGAVAGIAVACGLVLTALTSWAIFSFLQKRRTEELSGQTNPFASWGIAQKDSGGAPQLKGARLFSFDELKTCTNNFAENNEIGSGGYGKVYKGILADGTSVAIKRAEYGSKQGALEFKNEIELLSRVHHKNLVSLIGFCYEQGEQMLVYEYVSNGTLRQNLQGMYTESNNYKSKSVMFFPFPFMFYYKKCTCYAARGIYLDWKKRLRIALGSARGLAYLHELANPPIIHRDVKSTNILLDDSFKAKVADFGLSKLVADTEKGHVSTQVKGTLGYLDPEYYMTQQLSEKSDVYSFGVVMLEILSGRLPISKGRYIVREFRMAIDPNDQDYYGLQGIVDPAIHDAAHTTGFRRFVQLAMECVDESASRRPTMNSVVKEIEVMLHDEGLSSGSSSTVEFEHAGTASASHLYRGPVVTARSNSSGSIAGEPPHPELKHSEP